MEYAQEEIVIFFMREKKKEKFLLRLMGTWSIAEVGARGELSTAKAFR